MAILINSRARKIMMDIDGKYFVIGGRHSRIVLTAEQVETASKINLEIPSNKEVLLNHFLIKKTSQHLRRKGEVGDLYLVFNLKWGIEDYEQISVALSYEEKDEEFIIKWIRDFAMTFPDNSRWLQCVKHLWSAKFPKQFRNINATISYYANKYEVSVHCYDGFSVEFREKLIDIFPFF